MAGRIFSLLREIGWGGGFRCAGDQPLFPPFAPAEPDGEQQAPETFVAGHGDPDADEAAAQGTAEEPAAAYGHQPHTENADAHRIPDVPGGGEAADHDDVDGQSTLTLIVG